MTTLALLDARPYGEDKVNILIENGVIAQLGADVDVSAADATYDCAGKVLLPGLVDMHVHLREPGREDTETIATGSDAAARGGFTAVFTMANTNPVIDQPFLADAVWDKGQAHGTCDVYPVGSITQGLRGEQLTEIGLMSRSHVRMFSDDGKCVNDPQLMRRAIEYAKAYDVLLAQHAEDHRMTEGACAHEGETGARLGLRGWPRVAEESIVARDAIMTRDYGGRLHICHASTEGTVELLRWAKAQGINVTAEVTPHHLLMTDEKLETYDGNFRVNPPLREVRDTHALREALFDGTVDVVATDHAPHGSEDKCVEFEHAKPGMLGLETSLAVISQVFVEPGLADWRFVAKVMSERPAQILKLADQGRPIAVGEPANLALVNPSAAWTARGTEMASKASNTPYEGMDFAARVELTLLRGTVTHSSIESN
ncbi:dihydroorotase [Corynebacterium lipophiloflavum]|uniref:Dihydroorotase n=1 Tax=Corynebacterium lipophiloflavum (strain ATCC 700352 / DSM 44291 / CCUG 37336 / JCM 10383 / DMMZ 1944) TaxID=525263 RepID=C0XSU2_CORLD|nr:dihydroorotase [Corynebacterium lipophiloflavum]EEI16722.1 amidohydrolase family protein [Corynebacterium lipophiloflavum DSM 44291]